MSTTNEARPMAIAWSCMILATTLVACVNEPTSTIVRVPASELPRVAPNTLRYEPPPTNVTTIDGKITTLQGPIESVELAVKRETFAIALPFKARVEGLNLEVLTDQVRTYPLADVSYAQIETLSGPREYVESPVRYGIGTAMIVVSVPFFVLGTVGVVSDIGCSPGGFLNFCGLGTAVGVTSILVGGAFVVPGALLRKYAIAQQAPQTRPRMSTLVRPTLRVSPSQISFSAEF